MTYFLKKDPIIEDQEEITNLTIGEVISVKDGVAFISGLPNIRVGEIIEFVDKNLYGMALNLEIDQVGCIIFGDDHAVQQGDYAKALDRLVDVPVGEGLLGRVVDGIGILMDGKENIVDPERFNVERKASNFYNTAYFSLLKGTPPYVTSLPLHPSP